MTHFLSTTRQAFGGIDPGFCTGVSLIVRPPWGHPNPTPDDIIMSLAGLHKPYISDAESPNARKGSGILRRAKRRLERRRMDELLKCSALLGDWSQLNGEVQKGEFSKFDPVILNNIEGESRKILERCGISVEVGARADLLTPEHNRSLFDTERYNQIKAGKFVCRFCRRKKQVEEKIKSASESEKEKIQRNRKKVLEKLEKRRNAPGSFVLAEHDEKECFEALRKHFKKMEANYRHCYSELTSALASLGEKRRQWKENGSKGEVARGAGRSKQHHEFYLIHMQYIVTLLEQIFVIADNVMIMRWDLETQCEGLTPPSSSAFPISKMQNIIETQNDFLSKLPPLDMVFAYQVRIGECADGQLPLPPVCVARCLSHIERHRRGLSAGEVRVVSAHRSGSEKNWRAAESDVPWLSPQDNEQDLRDCNAYSLDILVKRFDQNFVREAAKFSRKAFDDRHVKGKIYPFSHHASEPLAHRRQPYEGHQAPKRKGWRMWVEKNVGVSWARVLLSNRPMFWDVKTLGTCPYYPDQRHADVAVLDAFHFMLYWNVAAIRCEFTVAMECLTESAPQILQGLDSHPDWEEKDRGKNTSPKEKFFRGQPKQKTRFVYFLSTAGKEKVLKHLEKAQDSKEKDGIFSTDTLFKLFPEMEKARNNWVEAHGGPQGAADSQVGCFEVKALPSASRSTTVIFDAHLSIIDQLKKEQRNWTMGELARLAEQARADQNAGDVGDAGTGDAGTGDAGTGNTIKKCAKALGLISAKGAATPPKFGPQIYAELLVTDDQSKLPFVLQHCMHGAINTALLRCPSVIRWLQEWPKKWGLPTRTESRYSYDKAKRFLAPKAPTLIQKSVPAVHNWFHTKLQQTGVKTYENVRFSMESPNESVISQEKEKKRMEKCDENSYFNQAILGSDPNKDKENAKKWLAADSGFQCYICKKSLLCNEVERPRDRFSAYLGLIALESDGNGTFQYKAAKQLQDFFGALNLRTDLQSDHVIPRGHGIHRRRNRFLVCEGCNRQKGNNSLSALNGNRNNSISVFFAGIIDITDEFKKQKRFVSSHQLHSLTAKIKHTHTLCRVERPRDRPDSQLNLTRWLADSLRKVGEARYHPEGGRDVGGWLMGNHRRCFGVFPAELCYMLRQFLLEEVKFSALRDVYLDEAGNKNRLRYEHHGIDALVVSLLNVPSDPSDPDAITIGELAASKLNPDEWILGGKGFENECFSGQNYSAKRRLHNEFFRKQLNFKNDGPNPSIQLWGIDAEVSSWNARFSKALGLYCYIPLESTRASDPRRQSFCQKTAQIIDWGINV